MNRYHLAKSIVDWYQKNKRDLPWRREPYSKNPYCVYVSEIMLQQTQVATVIPYWERWMRELPTIQSLAEAAPERVLKLWEGLGYYSRARNLQKAAQLICQKHNGLFPTASPEILDLPGVGRYTAGAVASIAFNQPTPIVDGNVARVLTRHFGIRGDPKSKLTNEALWSRATELVQAASDRSSLNQGLMELGATICRPSEPLCPKCPIHQNCFALKNKVINQLPEVVPRPKTKPRIFRAQLIRRNGHILLRQRPDGVVNSGFWEMPNSEAKSALKTGVLCQVQHSITRFRMTLEVVPSKSFKQAGEWVSLATINALPLVNAHRKALQQLGLLQPSKE